MMHLRPAPLLCGILRNLRRSRLPFLCAASVFSSAVLFSNSAIAESSAETSDDTASITARYDWVPREELTPEQQAALGPACRGAFVDPLSHNTHQTDPAKTPIEIDAGSADMRDGQEVILEDNVEISQGSRRLRAGKMHFVHQTGKAELEKDVEIRQAGMLVRGSAAKVNMAGNEATFQDGQFVLHPLHVRGKAEQIEQKNDGTIVLEGGEFTSCEPTDNSWKLEGSRLTINPKTQQGSGKHVILRIADFPVIYVPYIKFPVGEQRQTGLLIPVITSSEGGIDFAQPWYWNIAPNIDATLTPRYAYGHGAMFETETRWLNTWSYNELGLAHLSDDDGGGDKDVDEAIEANLNPALVERTYYGEDRWMVDFSHKGGFNQRWYSDIQYAKASDIDYIRDLNPASFDSTNETFLSQRIALGYRLNHWHFGVSAQNYQHLLADIDDSYRQLPRIHINGKYRWGDYGLDLNNEYVRFEHRDEYWLNGNRIITGQRVKTDTRLDWAKRWSFGFVNPTIGLQSLNYVIDDENLRAGADDRPALATTFGSIDAGLFFERDNGRQTLEPRIFYLYRDHADHSDLYNLTDDGGDINFDTTPLTFNYNQLFRDSRFVGGDRLDDANQLTVGITGRLFTRQGRELINASLGRVYYFHDRSVTLSDQIDLSNTSTESDIAGQLNWIINRNFRIGGNVLFNPETDRLIRATTHVGYQDEQERIFNIGYRYVREQDQFNTTTAQTIDQIDLSMAMPIDDQWKIYGRIFYDLDETKELDTFLGFEYDDCCYRLRVLAQHRLDSKLAALVNDDRLHYDWSIRLEVELKGLASTGQHIRKMLRESIPGFGDY